MIAYSSFDEDMRVLSPVAMRSVDSDAIAEDSGGFSLMKNAARAVAREISFRFEPGHLAVLCGPGNNGGDGYVIAHLLRAQGWPVQVYELPGMDAAVGDARAARALWDAAVLNLEDFAPEEFSHVVDALFGTGLTRDIGAAIGELFERIGRSGVTVTAVDIPSGIDGKTGEIKGGALRADLTITFCRPKPGHFLLPGAQCVGELKTVDIGIEEKIVERHDCNLYLNLPELWRDQLRLRSASSHKYTHGHALVVAGPQQKTGAARLASLAALRAGAGLVTILADPEAASECANHMTEVMVRSFSNTEAFSLTLRDHRIRSLLLGPGMGVGSRTRNLVSEALAAKISIVLDADALTSCASVPSVDLSAGNVVLTPHEGEFARLFPEIKGDRIERVRLASERVGAVVLLKGGDTVISEPQGRVVISPWGSPELAVAGTGDVLAGIITGLIAQGLSTFDAACAGAWYHSRASLLCDGPLVAGDLLANLHPVRQELGASLH